MDQMTDEETILTNSASLWGFLSSLTQGFCTQALINPQYTSCPTPADINMGFTFIRWTQTLDVLAITMFTASFVVLLFRCRFKVVCDYTVLLTLQDVTKHLAELLLLLPVNMWHGNTSSQGLFARFTSFDSRSSTNKSLKYSLFDKNPPTCRLL